MKTETIKKLLANMYSKRTYAAFNKGVARGLSEAALDKLYIWLTDYEVKAHFSHHDWIQDRADLKADIDRLAVNGVLNVYTHSTDCDMSYSDHVFQIPAQVVRFIWNREAMYNNAEGRCGMTPISAADAEDFEPVSRDLALEAYEDGHPGTVSLTRFEAY